jgi:hypothetical protein
MGPTLSEETCRSVAQEFQEVHYRVHKSPSLFRMLSQIIQSIPLYPIRLRLTLLLPSHPLLAERA